MGYPGRPWISKKSLVVIGNRQLVDGDRLCAALRTQFRQRLVDGWRRDGADRNERSILLGGFIHDPGRCGGVELYRDRHINDIPDRKHLRDGGTDPVRHRVGYNKFLRENHWLFYGDSCLYCTCAELDGLACLQKTPPGSIKGLIKPVPAGVYIYLRTGWLFNSYSDLKAWVLNSSASTLAKRFGKNFHRAINLLRRDNQRGNPTDHVIKRTAA